MDLFEITTSGLIQKSQEADSIKTFVISITGAFKIMNAGVSDYLISFPASFVGDTVQKEQGNGNTKEKHYLFLKSEHPQWIFAQGILHKFTGIAFSEASGKQEVYAVFNPTTVTSSDYDRVFDDMSEVWAVLKPEQVVLVETLDPSQYSLSKYACKR